MSELITIARPYARAAFEYAKENHKIDEWLKILSVISNIAQENKIKRMLVSPVLSGNDKASLLLQIYDENNDTIAEQFSNFIKLLAESGRLVLLPQIVFLFYVYWSELENKITVKVSSAFALTVIQKKNLTKILQDRLKQNIDLVVSIDSTLVGGLVISANNLIIDGSVRGRLTKLAETLKFN